MRSAAAGCQRKTRAADPHAFARVAGGAEFHGKVQAAHIVENKPLV